MRRRGVLHIGVTGLAAMLVQGCSEGSTEPPEAGATPSGSSQAGPMSTFDPSGHVPPQVPMAELRKLFNYDSKAPHNAQLTDKRTGDGVILEDLTFAGGREDVEVAAYVLGPERFTGRLPAVIYAHGSDGNRDSLLQEAMSVAELGALVLMPGLPLKPSGDAVADSKVVVDSVVALRRGLDLLVRRSDCDGSRVGFVGHSWGAAQAAVMYGVDARLTATVLASAPGRISRWMVRQNTPSDWRGYLDALSRFDAVQYVAVTGRKAVLLQYGEQDPVVVEADRAELTAAAAGPKERKDYDAGHDVAAFPAATTDRVAFLRKQLRLK